MKNKKTRYIKYIPMEIEKIPSPPSSSPLSRIKSYKEVSLIKNRNFFYNIKRIYNYIKQGLNDFFIYLSSRSNNSRSNIHRN
jgi:hypothetical protein